MIAPIRNYLLNVEIPSDGSTEQQAGDAGEDDDTPFGGASGAGDDIFGPMFDADRSRQAVEGGAKDASTVSAPTVTPSSSTVPLSTLLDLDLDLPQTQPQQTTQSTRSTSSNNDLGVVLSGSPSGSEAPAQTGTSTTTPSMSHSSSSTPDSQLTSSSSTTITASTSPAPGSGSGNGGGEAAPTQTSLSSDVAVALTPQQQQAAAKNAARLQYNLGVLRHIQTIFGHLLSSRLQYYTPRGFWKHFKYAYTK